jgi:hypothetical protein
MFMRTNPAKAVKFFGDFDNITELSLNQNKERSSAFGVGYQTNDKDRELRCGGVNITDFG